MKFNLPSYDKIPEDNLLYGVLSLLAFIGAFDLVSEILDSIAGVSSSNFVKKILLWAVIYSKTKSVVFTTIVAIVIIAMLPKVFFGELTGPRVNKKEEPKEIIIK